MIETAQRYAATVRHLKPEQVIGRAWNRFVRARPDLRPASGLRPAAGAWAAPVGKSASLVGPERFRFLGTEASIKAATDWNLASAEKLWLYNLHYFDDLNAKGAADRRDWHHALIGRWIAENPAGAGNGWEPYPTSLRIVNWIKWALSGAGLDAAWHDSLAAQARWLDRRIEWHILGNHLFANAKALVFAGLYFEGDEADLWLSRGAAILAGELHEQILDDGGHFELSPMYHAIILEDVLDLLNLARTYPGVLGDRLQADLRTKAEQMLSWLDAMRYPDRRISFFNDAAFGIAAEPDDLSAYGGRLGVSYIAPPGRIRHLEETGYVRLEAPDCVALLDVARVGPDYLPGHAHADTLSFELSLFGQRVVVNGGTSVYGLSEERTRQRSTAAHSTVEIAGANSSDVWAGFRVGRRAYPKDLQISDEAGRVSVECSHTGYRHLPGKPEHRRSWEFSERSLAVTDTVTGGAHSSVARFHLHPDCSVVEDDEYSGKICVAGRGCASWKASGPVRVVPSTWHPEFGVSVPSLSLELPLTDGHSSLEISW